MVAKRAWLPSQGMYSVGTSHDPFDPTAGTISHIRRPRSDLDDVDQGATPAESHAPHEGWLNENPRLEDFLRVASLANLAHVHLGRDGWKAQGNPTEVAIQVFASRFDRGRNRLTQELSWVSMAEFPFDSDVKLMSVIYSRLGEATRWVLTKGAVERVIDSCTIVHWEDSAEPTDLTPDIRDRIMEHMDDLAVQGLRVLAMASRVLPDATCPVPELSRDQVEQQLTFHGLIGLYDPPRVESADAIQQCRNAGIAVHMLTGDHPGTARAIAADVGLVSATRMATRDVAETTVMTAAEFDRLSDGEIDGMQALPLVIARCTPNTKVRMIEALHRRRRFAAMTGDGVNDSPALRSADVGIAMGQAGSDVAKDASDIVLTDDNFASILNAVEEGRRMSDNIQKFVLHLLSENIAQACTLLIGLAFKDTSGLSVFPLTPVEILWVIMITSGLPDMGLGFERASPDVMARPPQSLRQGVFTLEVMADILIYGLWMAALCLTSFIIVVFGFGDGDLGSGCNSGYSTACETVFRARATTFVCLTWFALFLAWELSSLRSSLFCRVPGRERYLTQWIHTVWHNQFLFWAVIAGFVTVFPTLYIPVINRVVFKHEGISWEWGVVFVQALLFVAGIEFWKWVKRIYFRRQAKFKAPGVLDVESRGYEK